VAIEEHLWQDWPELMLDAAAASDPAVRALDLGCGQDKLPGAVGMDSNPRSRADVIHDLDQRPWPLESSSFDYVRAQDVLEHVIDFVPTMEEIHRVAKHGATIDVRMPFMSSLNFATDPTHRRAATRSTFDYFDPRTALGQYRYSTARFETISFKYGRFYHGAIGAIMKVLDVFMLPLCHRAATVYEHYFAFVYPMHDISFSLRVVKDE
jgi:hypothetical protein